MGAAADEVRAPHVHTPGVDLTQLTGRFPRWAERKLVPKVLVANQTRILEAVADLQAWLPGVPVNTVTPAGLKASVDEIAASADVPGGVGAGAAIWRPAPARRR